jgi:hypothetical protein
MSGAERRQHERFELVVVVQATLSHGEKSETFTVINISAGGVLLRNDRNAPFTSGEEIHVRFDVTELGPAFAIDGKVIRVMAPTTKPGLLAAMWTSSDVVANAALSELLWGLSKRR